MTRSPDPRRWAALAALVFAVIVPYRPVRRPAVHRRPGRPRLRHHRGTRPGMGQSAGARGPGSVCL